MTGDDASTALAAPAASGATNALPTPMEAFPRSPAWLASAYPMVPEPPLTASMTPDVPSAPSPDLNGQVSLAAFVQALAAVWCSQSVKLFVVPESSERCTGVIFVDGRLAPGLSLLISGSFHEVTLPEKMSATVVGDRLSFVTPLRLKTRAIGLM